MNQVIKERWLNALDQYPHSEKYLKTDDGYCVLGVLCLLYIKDNSSSFELKLFGSNTPIWNIENHWAELPDTVVKWAGLKNEIGLFYPSSKYPEFKTSLVRLNDGKRCRKRSVKELQKIIERYF